MNVRDNAANYVYDLYEDEAHTIYAATQQGIFEKKSGEASFHQKMPEITQGETVFANKGILYVGNRQGLHIYDGKTSRLITVGASRMGVENGVRDILADKQGNIWFLSRYAPEDRQVPFLCHCRQDAERFGVEPTGHSARQVFYRHEE